jgi:hypothetical protein
LPDVAAYVPFGHFWHVVSDDDPVTTEYLPGLHGTQSELPDVSTYLPLGHSWQDDPFTNWPGAHDAKPASLLADEATSCSQELFASVPRNCEELFAYAEDSDANTVLESGTAS